MSPNNADLDLAGRVVDLARAQAGPAAHAEVTVERAALALTRFANSYIHQNVADSTVAVRLRLHVDGRTATGTTSATTADGLRDLVERARSAARLLPPDPGWPGLAPPAPVAGPGNWDDATAHASPDERAARVLAFVEAAGGLETAGYCRTAHRTAAFANSAGQSVTGHTSEAAMDGIARTADADDRPDGVARLACGRIADLDGAALGEAAAAKARAGAGRVELAPGRYEVVLEPGAVIDVLWNLAMFGFNGKAYAERCSFAEPGTAQFDPAVTIVDDALGPGCLGLPFDHEGTPKRHTVMVDAGVTRTVAHDRRTAAAVGAQSTGHARHGGWGPVSANLRLEPGAAPIADLVAGMSRGLLITDLWYTRVLDPKSLVLTGLTRNGVWLVKDGKVTTAVRDLRFTQSYPAAFGPGAVLGVGAETTMAPDPWGTAWWTAPAVRLASWQFTGGASG